MIAERAYDPQRRVVGDGGPAVRVFVNGKKYSKVLVADVRAGSIRVDIGWNGLRQRRQTRVVRGTVTFQPVDAAPRGS